MVDAFVLIILAGKGGAFSHLFLFKCLCETNKAENFKQKNTCLQLTFFSIVQPKSIHINWSKMMKLITLGGDLVGRG